jgi:hypothetical protein
MTKDLRKKIANKLNGDKMLNGCGAKNGEEVDGWEFEVGSLEEFIKVLKTYKSIHLNYFDGEDDLDLWVRLE